jgi:hypothetical protein
MKVRSSTRATSPGSSGRGSCWGAALVELRERAGVDEQLAEPLVLLVGAVAPLDGVGLAQLGDLGHPGEEVGVGGPVGLRTWAHRCLRVSVDAPVRGGGLVPYPCSGAGC